MYDVIIIGGGPAGLTAGVYLARAGVKTLILEKETIGGQISSSPLVENYPGYKAISGTELADLFYEQIENLDVPIEIEEAKKIENFQKEIKKVITDYDTYECKCIIIATGSKYKLLKLENEKELIGKGIHFCTSCDGAFYKNKDVAVIGGANSAAINALYLSELCNKVYLIYHKEKLRCEQKLLDTIIKRDNIEIIYNANVTEIIGKDRVEGIYIDNERYIKLKAIFESIGMIPATEITKDFLNLDLEKYIDSNDMNTNVKGIFVAGDCRKKAIRQLTTATSDGTIAANLAIDYLRNLKPKS